MKRLRDHDRTMDRIRTISLFHAVAKKGFKEHSET